MEKAIIMKALFTAFTIGTSHLPLQSSQISLPFFKRMRSLYQTYVSGVHIFLNQNMIQQLKVQDILETLHDSRDLSSIMILFQNKPIGFLPIYEIEQRIQLKQNEILKVKVLNIQLDKPSWEQIEIEVLACEK